MNKLKAYEKQTVVVPAVVSRLASHLKVFVWYGPPRTTNDIQID